jgi:hypothetical protein
MLGSARAGLRFELVLPDGPLEPLEDPFVSIGDGGRTSRILLGRVALGPATLRLLALKVQRDVPPEGVTNPEAEAAGRRELAALRATDAPEVVRLLDAGPEFDRNRPVTLCKTTRRTFHPLCPNCVGPLQDCRDDALLSEAGLKTYTESGVRYLHCPACAARREGGPVTFYTESPGGGETDGKAAVRPRNELYRDGGAILRASVSAETRERLEAEFPCYTCEHREECYSEGSDPGRPILAESRLVPVAFHEFHAIPMELLPLRFDEAADLAGGADWSAVRRRALETGGTGRGAALAALDGPLASSFQWFHHGDRTGKFPLEVLRLKLGLFSQAARGVRALHAATGRPHGDLGPASVLVDLPATGPEMPVRWGFRAKLVDVGGPGAADPGVAADLAGLGKLFFRTFLVHDAQDEEAVKAAVARVLEKLRASLEERGGGADLRAAAGQLQVHLDSEREIFDRAAVVHEKSLREGKENLVPPGLWRDLLTLGFRLVSPVPEFGYAAPADRPEGMADRILGDLDLLTRRTHIELVARGERNREISKICDTVLAEVGGAGPAKVRGSESTRIK